MDRLELVSGRWLVKAMLATLALAGVALYLTVCLLFYQGQWQFVFFPHGTTAYKAAGNNWLSGSWAKRVGPASTTHVAPGNVASIAADSGLPISDQRFDYTQEGVSQLDGWWIPGVNAAPAANSPENAASSMVVLFCPNGRTTLPDNIPAFRALHSLGVSVFAFDYRGFGASQPGHPSQQKAYQDGVASLQYLTSMRHINPSRIVLYGVGLGSAVAAHVVQQSPQIAGIVLENPQPSLAKEVKREQHIHALPMWLIFSERFDISRIVPSLKMPKLVIVVPTKPEYETGAVAVYNEASAPRQKIQLDAAMPVYAQPGWQKAMQSFLKSVAVQPH